MALVLVILSGWWRVTLVGLVAYLLLWPPVPGKRSGGAFANAAAQRDRDRFISVPCDKAELSGV